MAARETGTLGARIREVRDNLGMTQRELAEELGVKTIQVSRWERNASRPTLARLAHLATIGGMTLSWFFNGVKV